MTLRAVGLPLVLVAPFGDLVCRVLCGRAQPEVRHVAAGWVVAVVKHVHSLRDRTVDEFPSEAMSSAHAITYADPPITPDAESCPLHTA